MTSCKFCQIPPPLLPCVKNLCPIVIKCRTPFSSLRDVIYERPLIRCLNLPILSLIFVCLFSCYPLPVSVCQGVWMSRNNCIKYSDASVFEPLFSAHSIMEFLNPIFDSIRQCESTKTSTGSWCLSFKQTRVTLSEHGCVTFPISKAMPRVGKKCDQKPVLNPPKSVWFWFRVWQKSNFMTVV